MLSWSRHITFLQKWMKERKQSKPASQFVSILQPKRDIFCSQIIGSFLVPLFLLRLISNPWYQDLGVNRQKYIPYWTTSHYFHLKTLAQGTITYLAESCVIVSSLSSIDSTMSCHQLSSPLKVTSTKCKSLITSLLKTQTAKKTALSSAAYVIWLLPAVLISFPIIFPFVQNVPRMLVFCPPL